MEPRARHSVRPMELLMNRTEPSRRVTCRPPGCRRREATFSLAPLTGTQGRLSAGLLALAGQLEARSESGTGLLGPTNVKIQAPPGKSYQYEPRIDSAASRLPRSCSPKAMELLAPS